MKNRCSSPLDMWRVALEFLPEDLDSMAFRAGALRRRRGFAGGEQLLRACLLYAHSNSFRTSAALARSTGLANVSSEAMFYRLSTCEAFLDEVLSHLVSLALAKPLGRRVVVVDATGISGQASKGTDFRVHVAYDPLRSVPCSVIVDTAFVGEHLAWHGLGPGVLALADRGYGTARNVDAALQCGADVLVRIHTGQMRLLRTEREAVDLAALEREIPATGALAFSLLMPVPPEGAVSGWRLEQALRLHPVRLVGARSKKGQVVWLLTNLREHALNAEAACELYRARWQVELYFKRLKSLGDIDEQLSRNGPTARASLQAKMILMVLTSLIQDKEQAFSPYGYPLRPRAQPLEGVRLHSEETAGLPASSWTGQEAPAASVAKL